MPGEYYLEKTIEFGPLSGPISIEAYESGTVCIKGSKILEGTWERYKGNIQKLKTAYDISSFSQLYIMKIPPFAIVHRMNNCSFRILPPGYTPRIYRIRSITMVMARQAIIIWISGQDLLRSIDVQLGK